MPWVASALSGLSVGGPATCRHLTVWPLVGDDLSRERYFTLDEAVSQGWAAITEISPDGSIPEVRIVNESPYQVLAIDGEELAGARQDRVVNLTVLVPHVSSLLLPVCGVEEGRWSYRGRTLRPTSRVQDASGRATRLRQVSTSLREIGDRRAHQAEVWGHVAALSDRLGTGSPTGALSAVFERHASAIEECVRAFGCVPLQRGACFEVAGGLRGLEVFDRADTCARLLPKLVRGYAIDALARPNGTPTTAWRSQAAVTAFLGELAGSRTDRFPAVGMGLDLRFEGAGVVGGALVAGDRLVHLVAFAGA